MRNEAKDLAEMQEETRKFIALASEEMVMKGNKDAERRLRNYFLLKQEQEEESTVKFEIMGVEIDLSSDTVAQLETHADDAGESLDVFLDRIVAGKWCMHTHKGADTMLSIKDVLEIDCIELAA